jgi:Tricorn protease C1 domain
MAKTRHRHTTRYKIIFASIAVLLLTGCASYKGDIKLMSFLFWTDVKDNHAYFDKKHTDWNKVKTIYLPQAKNAKNRDELITVFENALEELYDNHFSLN